MLLSVREVTVPAEQGPAGPEFLVFQSRKYLKLGEMQRKRGEAEGEGSGKRQCLSKRYHWR